MYNDTIAAISTAIGESGIGIIRISGYKTFEITKKLFKPIKNKEFNELKNKSINYGHIIDPQSEDVIDEVLISVMQKPFTYTTEDVVEINCHGGIVSIKTILELVLKNGARLAEPGEFTKRAFVNGRIDLTQAEAVIDIITSKTQSSMKSALSQLEGGLSKKINSIKEILLNMLAHIEVSIDYPEYDIEEVTYKELKGQALKAKEKINLLLETSEKGKIIRDGLNTVIIGRPNVGKSSLLNALLREKRAIVTEIPGTTRDIIEEYINIGGILLKIVDTAGIRETNNIVEQIGVQKARELLEDADLVLFILDASVPLTEDDKLLIKLIQNKQVIVILNKIDLDKKINLDELDQLNKRIIQISALKDIGIDFLEKEIVNMVFGGEVNFDSQDFVSNIRHKDLLEKSLDSVNSTLEIIDTHLPFELVSIDIRDSLNYLGQITGDTLNEDIIDQIFAKFCIGK